MLKKWIEISSKEILTAHVFRFIQKVRQTPDGKKEGTFDVLQCRNWINILAFDENENLIMVRQYRHGINELSLEFPAGVIDQGEAPLDAAIRELQEETGYSSSDWQEIGKLNPNPAFIDNECRFFLARNCKKTHETNFDYFEEIETELYKLSEVKEMIAQNKIGHSLVACGLYFYDNLA